MEYAEVHREALTQSKDKGKGRATDHVSISGSSGDEKERQSFLDRETRSKSQALEVSLVQRLNSNIAHEEDSFEDSSQGNETGKGRYWSS